MSQRHGNLQKYDNPNPVQRYLINRFLRIVRDEIASLSVSSVLDVGCAEGFVSRYLLNAEPQQLEIVGGDLDLAALHRGMALVPTMRFLSLDIHRLPFPTGRFDLVMATEVLEHLPDPKAALRELRRVTARYCLLSVPHEPWFRALNFLRGKHLRSWGNDPDHLQNWTGRQFAALVSQEFEFIASKSAFPWSIVVGRKRGG
jgi:ubiquinone/menaquinone biosynthesis C-methylase UbiE